MNTILLQTPPLFWVCATFLFGAILGSFVNAAIYRLPRNISMLTESRSFCPKCKAMIHWYDNIPIFSFLILMGKCRGCKQPIPSRYLKVELLVASLFALSAYQFWILNRPSPPTGNLSEMPFALHAVQLFLVADLICATYTDLEMWYIPIETTWPWVIAGLILAPLCPELHPGRTFWTGNDRWDALIDSFQGIVYGAGILWGIGIFCVVYLKKEGMGGGDAHIVAMIGALLGWKAALETLMLGVTLGSVIGIAVLSWDRMKRKRLGKDYKPYQPVYEMPDQEEDAGLGPSWPFISFGVVTLAVQGSLYYISYSAAPTGWFVFDMHHMSALGGVILGATFFGGGFVRWHLIRTEQWPKGEIREREDGKKEEVLEGNYLPFGPFLALAGLIVVFYDPLIREYLWWYMFDRYNVPAWMAAGGLKEIPWSQYVKMNPLPYKVPFGP